MTLAQLMSRLRFLSSQLAEEASHWDGRHKTLLLRAAKQCTSTALTLRRAPEGSGWHHAGVALHDEAINLLVATIARRTPADAHGRNHA